MSLQLKLITSIDHVWTWKKLMNVSYTFLQRSSDREDKLKSSLFTRGTEVPLLYSYTTHCVVVISKFQTAFLILFSSSCQVVCLHRQVAYHSAEVTWKWLSLQIDSHKSDFPGAYCTVSHGGTSGYALSCETVSATFSSREARECAGLVCPEACVFLCDSTTERHVLLALVVWVSSYASFSLKSISCNPVMCFWSCLIQWISQDVYLQVCVCVELIDKHSELALILCVYVVGYTGPLCGQLAASDKTMLVNSTEVTVHFVSSTHRSGRGFLLSYSTNQHPGITH